MLALKSRMPAQLGHGKRASQRWSAKQVLLVCPGISTTNLVNNAIGAILGTTPTNDYRELKPNGRMLLMHPGGGGNGVACVDFPATDGITEDFTFFWFGFGINTNTNGQLIGRGKDGSGNGWNFTFALSGDNSLTSSVVTASPVASYTATVSGLTLNTTTYYRAASVRRGTTLKTFFGNTRASASSTIGSGLRTSDTGIGIARSNSDGSGHNYTHIVSAFSGALTDAETWEILDNPMLLVAPQRVLVPFGAAAPSLPILSAARAKTGSITSTGWISQITAS